MDSNDVATAATVGARRVAPIGETYRLALGREKSKADARVDTRAIRSYTASLLGTAVVLDPQGRRTLTRVQRIRWLQNRQLTGALRVCPVKEIMNSG